MNSIYKQLNKIDDSNSLNEKWNVKNQRELKKLKEDIQRLDETNPLVKEIQEYIHDNIFEWDTIGFENDHIYIVFDEDTEEYTIDSCEEELEDEFGHACELAFELENENTLLIYVSISDEVDDDNYEWFVEHQVDYSLRAKDAQITERDYGYEFLWISQEDLSDDDAYELAVATNNYLVHLNKVGKLVKGTCYCRSYPEDDYKVQFTVKENLRFDDVEDATVYEYGIIDDSEYVEEEYTTDWNEALETFKNTAHNVQERLLDMDDEEYDDYYSDGVVVRMIKGKEGSDAFDWDTIREVTVFRDSIENEEELEEQLITDGTAELSAKKELDKVDEAEENPDKSLTEDYEIYELPDKQLANYINELDNACYSAAQKELVFDECSTRINDKGVITITFSDKYRSTYGEGTIETLKRNAQNSADKLKQAAESFLESNSANPLNNRIKKITTHSNATQYHSAQYICVVKKTFGIKIYTDITNQNFPVRVDPKIHIKQLISYLGWPTDCLQATGGRLNDSILSYADTVRRGSYYCLRISARSSYKGVDAFDTIKSKIQKFIDENNLSRSYIDTKLHYDHLYVYIQSA